jgi:hypothetical protein
LQWSYKVPVLKNNQAILFSTAPPPCAPAVTSPITVTRGGFRYNNTTKRFVQTVTLLNNSASAVQGTISLVLDNLSVNATLFNKTGSTSCTTPAGSPFINIPSITALSPGQSVSIILELMNSNSAGITYTTRVLAGNGAR